MTNVTRAATRHRAGLGPRTGLLSLLPALALGATVALTALQAAKVPHVLYRGAHGFRRGVAGNVHSATGSSKKAADWIGDKSTRVVEKHYLKTRQDDLSATAELVARKGE